MDGSQERDAVRVTIDRIEMASGKRPVGWLGAGLAETWNTLDYLAEAGIRYVCDWVKTRARARAREAAENQRPWPADKVRSAWYSNEPGAGSALGRPASAPQRCRKLPEGTMRRSTSDLAQV
jgi:peptidoglycan/xylan/chitin deacetylase (PgdA/CDA1 family)